MMTNDSLEAINHTPAPWRRRGVAIASAMLLAAALLSCHSGTPAAPEGTLIILEDCEFVDGTRNVAAGDFEGVLHVRLLDSASNVPQVGVGVFFLVDSGPGRFANPSPIVTTNAGRAQNVLIGVGATSANPITVRIISGEAAALTLDMDVEGCIADENFPPVASFTVTPSAPRVNTDVTVDVSASTDPDCPGGRPESWTVSWGDGTATESSAFSTPTRVHRYTTANQTYTISVTVSDCDNLTGNATRMVTIAP